MFKVKKEITREEMRDILCTAIESGHYGSVLVVGYKGDEPRDPWESSDGMEYWPRYCTAPLNGGAMIVKTKYSEDDKDPVLGGKKIIDKEALQRGLDILGEKYPQRLSELIEQNYDVIAPDCLLQCAAFGDIIYG